MSNKQRPVVVEAMEQRVLFNAGLLKETIVSTTLPTRTYNGRTFSGSVTYRVTNTGSASEVGKVALGIFISRGGIDLHDPSTFSILTSTPTTISLAPGHSSMYTLTVDIGKNKLALGTDTMYAVVAEPDGSSSASAPGPKFTVVAGPPSRFSDTIISAKPVYAVATTQEYADELDMAMSIHNTGGLSNGKDHFSLFASTSSTFDSSARLIGHVVLGLKVPKGIRNFLINFGGLPNLGSGKGESKFHIFVQVTDTFGHVTLGSFPNEVALTLPRP